METESSETDGHDEGKGLNEVRHQGCHLRSYVKVADAMLRESDKIHVDRSCRTLILN
jgi:hypothetical protein